MDWGDGLDEVVQNSVGDRLGKRSSIPERVQIKFQGFALHALLFWGVANGDGREVGLTRDGAEGSKFRGGESDFVGAARFGVRKSFQTGQRRICWDGNFTTEKAEAGHP